MNRIKFNCHIFITLATLLCFISCKKFVEIDHPRTELVSETVFTSDVTANAAVANVYKTIRSAYLFNGTMPCLNFAFGCASDELISQHTGFMAEDINRLQSASITPTSELLNYYWSDSYAIIYNANVILEGLVNSTGITASLKAQYEGEAKFVRALLYFYLVNVWGDVPLITSSDYQVNSNIAKTVKAQVYDQIVSDLKDAQVLLPDTYPSDNEQRVRANKSVATALLARIYLYLQDWANAETEATAVIDNNELYELNTDLNSVFNITSKEQIFQLWQSVPYTQEGFISLFFSVYLQPDLVNVFESGDQRLAIWLSTDGVKYYPNKYKFLVPDFASVLRLSEQYLIRAEARIHLDKLTGANSAAADLDKVRERAGLLPTTAATTEELKLALEKERLTELFSENGHRWFDLKRMGKATEVLAPLKPDWESWKELMPIPQSQIDKDPAMVDAQNFGY